jgi:hypothetical protein
MRFRTSAIVSVRGTAATQRCFPRTPGKETTTIGMPPTRGSAISLHRTDRADFPTVVSGPIPRPVTSLQQFAMLPEQRKSRSACTRSRSRAETQLRFSCCAPATACDRSQVPAGLEPARTAVLTGAAPNASTRAEPPYARSWTAKVDDWLMRTWSSDANLAID